MENLLALDDASLLERYLVDGDESAITVLYLRYQPKLYGFARRHTHDPEDARDIVQDTWEALLTFRDLATIQHFHGFVFKVALNLLQTFHRRQRRDRTRRAAFVFEGLQTTSYPGPMFDLPNRKPDGTCLYCGRKAVRGKGLCHAHAMRRSRGATEEDMRRPVRPWRKKC